MGRSKTYWIMVLIGAIAAVGGIFMVRSEQLSLHTPGKIVGWTGIALLLISRIFFARKQQPKPKAPDPKSDLKIS